MDAKIIPEADFIKRFDELYQRDEPVWGTEPSLGVEEALPFLRPGRVLDLGSGDGRNALFLAQQGFDVTAIDILPSAIASLAKYAARAKLQEKIEAIVADVETYRPEGQFENIITTFTLHFLPVQAFPGVLARIMEWTTSGGVNVIEDFTKNGPLYTQALNNYGLSKQGVVGHWLESGELKGLYEERGWSLLYYSEMATMTRATDEQGNPYMQEAARLVAAKPQG